MADYLMREEAPLTSEEWERLDNLVVETARQHLIGRRFIHLAGPFGAGLQSMPLDSYKGTKVGVCDLIGEEECSPVQLAGRSYLALPIIHKDFWLLWRDISASRQFGFPLDLSPAVMASIFCAQAEDNLIFHGDEKSGLAGLLNVEGRNTIPLSDWDEGGNAFHDIVAATEKLVQAGFYGPYAGVVSPAMHTKMYRVYKGTGMLEISQVRQVLQGGLFQSPALGEGVAVVVSIGQENFDLAVAQDLITAYMGPDKMNHFFRVFESLALRVKRPDAICTLETKKK